MFALLVNVIFLYSSAFSLIGLAWVVFIMVSYYYRAGSDLAITYFAEDYIANHGKA